MQTHTLVQYCTVASVAVMKHCGTLVGRTKMCIGWHKFVRPEIQSNVWNLCLKIMRAKVSDNQYITVYNTHRIVLLFGDQNEKVLYKGLFKQ